MTFSTVFLFNGWIEETTEDIKIVILIINLNAM